VALAKIWAELLNLNSVGLRDNFFDLGGHSLLATQVISRIRRAFAVDLPLRRLFEQSVLADLAAAIDERRAAMVPEQQLARIIVEMESITEEDAWAAAQHERSRAI
jgi:acyl carrier protein